MDSLPDQLLSKVLQNLVDLTDFRNCRLTSLKWKRVVMDACSDKFHIVYALTGSTLYTANQLKDAPVSFDIYAFTGIENRDAWATSGIEPFMQTTEWLQFSGSEVNTEEIRKFLGLSHDSLKTLSFECIGKDLAHPFLEMQETFSALRKVSLGYHGFQHDNDTFNTFTSILEKWNSLDCRVQLPLLESLNLYYDSRVGTELPIDNTYFYRPTVITTEELFRNYVATAKLLLKYKQTLKEVQIARVGNLHFYLSGVEPEWAEMERGLGALDELNLNRLQVTLKPVYTHNNDTYTGVGIELLGQPKNIKNILFNSLMCTLDTWSVLIATLPIINNVDDCYLTSIKMNLNLRLFSDRTMVINLGVLKKCIKLRTFWLNVNSPGTPARLTVRNLELLPKGISRLRFDTTNKHLWSMGEEIHVTQQQICWIINNLRDLESFWMSLVLPEQANANENIEQGEDNNEDNDAQLQQDVNRLPNISLDTFRDLIAMPRLKDLKVIMMNARALSLILRHGNGMNIRRHGEQAGLTATLNVAREYSDLCEAAGYTTTTTSAHIIGVNNTLGFVTLAIQKN